MTALALISGGVFMSSCSKGETEPEQPEVGEISVSIKTQSSDASAGYSFVSVKCGGEWALSAGEASEWASVSPSEGSGSTDVAVLSWNTNTTTATRTLTLVLSSGAKTAQAIFTQYGRGVTPEVESDPVPVWLELPATNNPSLYFFTHPMTINSVKTRNFSYYWDTKSMVAHWVAYPLNKTLGSGSCGRSEKWGGTDPKMPVSMQPVLSGTYGSGYARGHQLPSADRQILEYNIQTFWGVNMTPQNYDLNGGQWASLEGFVRNKSHAVDTLYVVTGCLVSGSTKYVTDDYGKKVTVPTGYFKALLAYSKNKTVGITNSTGGYTGIGYYFDNSDCSDTYQDHAVTLDKLESITGFDFFVNLPAKIGTTKADKVESTLDSWWTNK